MAQAALPDLDVSTAALAKADFGRLTDESELGLIRLLASWPRTVESAAEAHEPHRIAFYLHDLAAAFHGLWTKGSKEDTTLRVIIPDDAELTAARLRSEEHTSELQSLMRISYAVFCLKKKKNEK